MNSSDFLLSILTKHRIGQKFVVRFGVSSLQTEVAIQWVLLYNGNTANCNDWWVWALWAVESDSIINECVNLSDLPKIVGIRQHSDSDLNSATSLGRDRSYWATWRSRSKTDVNWISCNCTITIRWDWFQTPDGLISLWSVISWGGHNSLPRPHPYDAQLTVNPTILILMHL